MSTVGPTDAAEDEPVLDEHRVEALRQLGLRSGVDLMPRMIDTFVSRAEVLVAALHGGLGPGEQVEAAHELKGSAATIGAQRLANCAARVEAAGVAGRRAEVAEVAQLAAELSRATEALRQASSR